MEDPKADPASPPSLGRAASIPVEVLNAPEAARFGKYVCTRRLGSGGAGDVWKAWDPELARWIALKFLKSDNLDEIQRFEREARTAAQLSHPSIATVFEVGQLNGRFYLTMQYVDGRTLHQFPRQDRRLLVSFVRDAARALAFAHQRDVVHRDIKPQNILIAGRSVSDSTWVGGRTDHPHRVYLTDFGLARSTQGVSDMSVTGTIMGTPAYMSPEQTRGQALDRRTDVYSLGVTLYELLCDRVPFKGANVLETLRKVQDEEPVPPRRLNPWVDRDLETIILKGMEKNRVRRYAGALELADDLDRWLDKEAILARPASLGYRLTKLFARRRTVFAASAVAAVVVIATLAIALPELMSRGNQLTRTRQNLSDTQKSLVQQMNTTAEICLEAAVDLRRTGNLPAMQKYADKVKASCAQVIEAVPELAEPHYLLGRIHRVQLKMKEALAEQTLAIERDPDYASAAYERLVLASRAYRTRMMEAVAKIHREVNEDPRVGRPGYDPTSLFITRVREMLQNEASLKEVMEALERDLAVLEKNPQVLRPGELACARGFRSLTRRDGSDAFRQFESATRLQPTIEEAYEELAFLCSTSSRFEEAERWYNRGIDQDRGYLYYYIGRGRVRHSLVSQQATPARAMALIDDAIADYTMAIAAGFPIGDAWLLRGQARHGKGALLHARGEDPMPAWTLAMADFDDSLRRHPQSKESLSGRAQTCMAIVERLGLSSEAVPHLDQAIRDAGTIMEIDPLDDDPWLIRGRARMVLAGLRKSDELHDASADDLRKVTVMRPAQYMGWFQLGLSLMNRAMSDLSGSRDPRPRCDESIQAFDKAAGLAPDRAEIHAYRCRSRFARTLWPGAPAEEVRRDLKLAADDLKAAEKAVSPSPTVTAIIEDLRRKLQPSEF